MKKHIYFLVLLALIHTQSKSQSVNYYGLRFNLDTKNGAIEMPNKLYFCTGKGCVINVFDSIGNMIFEKTLLQNSCDSIEIGQYSNHDGNFGNQKVWRIISTDSVAIYESFSGLGNYSMLHAIPPDQILGSRGTYISYFLNAWWLNPPYPYDNATLIGSGPDSIKVDIYYNQQHPLLLNPPYYSVYLGPYEGFYDNWAGDFTGTQAKVDSTFSNGLFQIYTGSYGPSYGGPSWSWGSRTGNYLLPYEFLTTKYHTIPHLTRAGDRIKVVAFEDSTNVQFHGGSVLLNEGEKIDTIISSPTTWVSNKKIEIVQVSRGQVEDSVWVSSSFAYPVFPDSSLITQSIFTTELLSDSIGTITQNYLHLLSPSNGVQNVWLDGNNVSANFNVFPDDSMWMYAQIPITGGVHQLHADSGVVAYLYGYGPTNGYGTIVVGMQMKYQTTALQQQPIKESIFRVYPNPAKEDFTLESSDNFENPIITITDLLGKVVVHQKYFTRSKKLKIATANLQEGMYVLNCFDKTHTIKCKIIIRH
jgi:hypothetical protein